MSHPLPSLPNATTEKSFHIHPIAHSLVAIHMTQGMATKLLGRRHRRLRFPHPPFSDAVHPACISGPLRTCSVYSHLGSSSRYNPCLIMLFFLCLTDLPPQRLNCHLFFTLPSSSELSWSIEHVHKAPLGAMHSG